MKTFFGILNFRITSFSALHKEIVASCRHELKYDNNKALSALLIACYHGNAILVGKLLKTGVNCRACFHSGKDALCVAVSRGHISCCELLCKYFSYLKCFSPLL